MTIMLLTHISQFFLLSARKFEVLPFVLMAILMVFLAFLVWHQTRNTKRLKSELQILKKVGKHNVEYEFVLEVMRLSIWH